MKKLCLVIIDQQKCIDSPVLGKRCNVFAETNMLRLINACRESGQFIVHVQHKAKDPKSVFWPEKAGFEFKDGFQPLGSELVVQKSVPCALTSGQLYQAFKENNCSVMAIIGACTSNSVEATARTAGNVGLPAFVVKDACFAFEKVDIDGVSRSAETVHAMSLANIAQDYAIVLDTATLLTTIYGLKKND